MKQLQDLSPGSWSRLKRSGGSCFFNGAEPLIMLLMLIVMMVIVPLIMMVMAIVKMNDNACYQMITCTLGPYLNHLTKS